MKLFKIYRETFKDNLILKLCNKKKCDTFWCL